jgi:hypothetical protein
VLSLELADGVLLEFVRVTCQNWDCSEKESLHVMGLRSKAFLPWVEVAEAAGRGQVLVLSVMRQTS